MTAQKRADRFNAEVDEISRDVVENGDECCATHYWTDGSAHADECDEHLSKFTPAEVDQRWLEAMEPARRALTKLIEARRTVNRYRKQGYAVEPGGERSYLLDRLDKAQAEYDSAVAAGDPFDEEYERRGGWTRYLIVHASNGHVHRSPGGCGSVGPTTLVSPLPQLSGNDDESVVTTCGHVACTKCFPDAPVNRELPPGRCPGSGQRPSDPDTGPYRSLYGFCAECGKHGALTPRGLIRAHKREETG